MVALFSCPSPVLVEYSFWNFRYNHLISDVDQCYRFKSLYFFEIAQYTKLLFCIQLSARYYCSYLRRLLSMPRQFFTNTILILLSDN